jgi:hypothetical protein
VAWQVYSFRYDDWQTCTVIGYDRIRKMHYCRYEQTGEKQWHTLATKRVEVRCANPSASKGTRDDLVRYTKHCDRLVDGQHTISGPRRIRNQVIPLDSHSANIPQVLPRESFSADRPASSSSRAEQGNGNGNSNGSGPAGGGEGEDYADDYEDDWAADHPLHPGQVRTVY